jgi:putative ABC transport system substrate-binding protein
VRFGLAKSLAQPGGNLTGLTSNAGPGITGKRLELLKETFPKIKIVGVLTNLTSETREGTDELTKTAAKALGLQIHHHYIKDASDIDRSFDVLKKLRVNALHVPAGSVTTLNSKRLIGLAAKLRVPAIYPTQNLVEEGGLMAYGVNFGDLYRRAAIYVDKILKGKKPIELPIEQPMKFELVVNLKTAEQIGVAIPPNVLARADRVIK